MVGSPLQYDRDIWSSTDAYALLRILVVSVVLSLANLQPLSAQDRLVPEYLFQQVQGVFVNTTSSNVVRDDEGYVWLGTPNGLFRYDGYGAKEYRNIPGELHSLSANYISALLVDKQKRLWIGTRDAGVSLYDRGSDQFYNLLPQPGDSSWYDAAAIISLTEDRRGNIWLGTQYRGVVRMELPSDAASENPDTLIRHVRFTTYELGTSRNTGGDVYEMVNGKMLLGSDRGLIILDPATHSISRLRLPGLAGTFLDSDPVNSLCPDSSDVFWAGTETKGLFRVDLTHATLKNYKHVSDDALSLISNQINNIALGRSGQLWIGTASGLQLFSPARGRAVPFVPFGGTSLGRCYTLSVDRSGTLWVGAGLRIYWLGAKSQRFPLYSLVHTIGQPAMSLTQAQRDRNGHLWFISMEGVLYQVDMATGTVVKSIRVLAKKEAAKSWINSFIDQRGIYWLGTNYGLFRVNLENGLVRHYDPDPGLPPLTVGSIAQASGDSLWIAAGRFGLKKFDPVSGKFTDVPGFERFTASMVMRDRHRRLWVCSATNGLAILDPATGQIERFRHNPTDLRSLSSDHCSNAYEDPAGRIWVASGTEVNLWDSTTHSFTRYSNGEQKHAQYSVILGSDRNGRLWVSFLWSTTSLLDPSTGVFTNYDETDGLFSDAPMQNLPDGTIVFPTWNGVNIFHPDSIASHRPAPPLVLTRMSINDQPVAPPRLTGPLRPVDLSFSQNTLEFEFAAIDIDAPTLVKYEYRLDGFEKEWSSPRDRRFVRYPSIPPGDYVFKVRALSIRAEWSDQEIALPISIAPPWWRTTWAYTAYAMLCLSFLVAAYRLRLRQIRLKQAVEMEHFQAEHLAEVDRLKSRFFANISHEFRTPLTLILGPLENILQKEHEKKLTEQLSMMKRSAYGLLRLINQLLDLSKLEAGGMKLHARQGNVIPVIKGVAFSFESTAYLKEIELQVSAEQDEILVYFDKEKIEKILINLLSNAFKFTPKGGAVTVTVDLTPSVDPPGESEHTRHPSAGAARICVRDSGTGIAPDHLPHIFDRFFQVDDSSTREQGGTGIGLALVKELVELHHGTIRVISQVGVGSEFTVTLPLGREHLEPSEIDEGGAEVVAKEPVADFETEEDAPTQTANPADHRDGDKHLILIIEDNADVRTYIKNNLPDTYCAVEANDGVEGIERAREAVPDLIISDVMMPKKDGFEVCRTLKSDMKTSHIPIILLTAKAASENKIEGLETGADDYLIKPFEPKELLARIKNLIELRRKLRERFNVTVPLKPGEVAVTSMDDAFLRKVMAAVEHHIGDEQFDTEDLAAEVAMSRMQLHRKLTALTKLSAGEFIRYIRLHRAMELLQKNAATVSEIAYTVGFSDPSYFSKCFHQQFGKSPVNVLKGLSEA